MFYPENEAHAKPTIHPLNANKLPETPISSALSFVCIIAKRRKTDELRPPDNDEKPDKTALNAD